MKVKKEVCICGGGNQAHVLGGYLASKCDVSVRLLTRRPEQWCTDGTGLLLKDFNGKEYRGRFSLITSDVALALSGADMVFICLPGFAIADELRAIKDYLTPEMYVGSVVSSTGFFLMAHKLLPSNVRLFGFQRVPFIARVEKYGSEAKLLGYKSSLSIAVENIFDKEALTCILSDMLDVPVDCLDSYLKVTLTNSNPILHPSRLYEAFGGEQKVFDHEILFYEEWNERSSEILISCDNEFHEVLGRLSFARNDVPTLLAYYECSDAVSLTAKIRSIRAFKGLKAPMRKIADNLYAPDYENRYFTEDIPYGLLLVKAYADKFKVDTPMIDEIISWAQEAMGKQYMSDGIMNGADLKGTIVPYVI